jgi:PTS system mannose-specific IIA component
MNSVGGKGEHHHPVFGVLVTHHNIGLELLKAAESIAGPQEDLVVLSNYQTGFDSLCQQIREKIPEGKDAIIMVDYFGGSAHLAAKETCKNDMRWVLVSGVNLPMVLSFVTKRHQLSFSQLVEIIRTDAVRGIR